jgi:hypothetical protein
VVSQRIYYLKPSNDPIFPARNKTHLPDNPHRTAYLNLAGAGTVMGCQDHVGWRERGSRDGHWQALSSMPQTPDKHASGAAVKRLLWYALTVSTTFSAISFRGGNALDAQARLSSMVSLPLHPHQYAIEAESLFNISLARIQIELHNIARGAGHRPGYVRQPTPVPICADTYIFNADGWVNVNRDLSVLLIVACALLILLAIPIGKQTLWPEAVLAWMISRGVRGCLEDLAQSAYVLFAAMGWALVQILSFLEFLSKRNIGKELVDALVLLLQ